MKVFICSVLVCLAVSITVGQAPSSASIVKLSEETILTPFIDLVTAIEKIRRPKGEFETTKEYETRISSLPSTPLVNGLKVTDSFVIPVGRLSFAFEATYDADGEHYVVVFNATDPFENPVLANGQRFRVIKAGSRSRPDKENTRPWGWIRPNFAVTNLEDFTLFKGDLRLKFPLGIDRAKAAKNQFDCLFVVRLLEPYHTRISEDPSTDVSLLFVEVEEVLLYNPETREVYGRVKAGER